MQAIAQLKPAIPVTALVPAVENMPGSRAQRPGDIVTTLAGKTVEVLNTDAEGRLILIDSLTYAQRLGCTHLVDAATLTGAVWSPSATSTRVPSPITRLSGDLLAAAKREREDVATPARRGVQRAAQERIRGSAQHRRTARRRHHRGPFLRDFVGDTPWVHLDIAGTAWLDDAKPYMGKGASGVGVRTFVKLAQTW